MLRSPSTQTPDVVICSQREEVWATRQHRSWPLAGPISGPRSAHMPPLASPGRRRRIEEEDRGGGGG
eukprot:8726127-Pyramimonas_sp.AAC.1